MSYTRHGAAQVCETCFSMFSGLDRLHSLIPFVFFCRYASYHPCLHIADSAWQGPGWSGRVGDAADTWILARRAPDGFYYWAQIKAAPEASSSHVPAPSSGWPCHTCYASAVCVQQFSFLDKHMSFVARFQKGNVMSVSVSVFQGCVTE